MTVSGTRWTSQILGQQAQAVYGELYGAAGQRLVELLEPAPYEITVISRLLACLHRKRGVR